MAARILLERDVEGRMRDGTVLRADVWRPDDGERHPALVQRTPYDKTFSAYTWLTLDPTKLALAGYAVVIQDARGRFASEGDFHPYRDDALDGEDSIAWAASQPWSDGTVGTYGVSYMGGVQWLAAARRPPALRAIASATSPNDSFENNLVRGGALNLGLLATWALASVSPNAIVRRHAGTEGLGPEFAALIDDVDALDERLRRVPLVPFPPTEDRGVAPWFEDWISADHRHPGYDELSRVPLHREIAVPALVVGGWYDVMLQPDLDHFVQMREGAATPEARRLTRLVVGPWAHGAFAPTVGELDFGIRASGTLLDLREDLTALHRRWFDARLRGSGGIDDEPPVRIFVTGRNRWRSADDWPPRARETRWHLHGDGALSPRPPEDEEPSVFTLDPEDPIPTHGGNVLMMPKHIRGPREQSRIEARPDVLVFTSEPLEYDLEVIGRARFIAWIAAETVDTDVVARLCDVHRDGRSFNVCDGILRLRFRESLAEPKPLTPGDVVRVDVDLWSTAHVFGAGHRLRLHVCASDFPRYDRCPGSGETSAVAKRVLPQRNLLFHDPQRPSHVVLPEVSS